MKILIAEDDFTSRVMLTGILNKNGYEVIETDNGLDALEILQMPDAPKLVILDWMMPKMEGLEVVRRIRSIRTNNPPYFIMLSAKSEKIDIITGLDTGCNDYLIKPFDVGELRSRVEVGHRMIELQDELLKSREALKYQATHDDLTGMINRRATIDQLSKEIERSARTGHIVVVGMCDIDHFKAINDTYGHQAGNDVLCGLAQIFKNNIRIYDEVGRIGGEEFLIIAPMEQVTTLPYMFSRLSNKVAESKIPTIAGELSITISIGVAFSGLVKYFV